MVCLSYMFTGTVSNGCGLKCIIFSQSPNKSGRSAVFEEAFVPEMCLQVTISIKVIPHY